VNKHSDWRSFQYTKLQFSVHLTLICVVWVKCKHMSGMLDSFVVTKVKTGCHMVSLGSKVVRLSLVVTRLDRLPWFP